MYLTGDPSHWAAVNDLLRPDELRLLSCEPNPPIALTNVLSDILARCVRVLGVCVGGGWLVQAQVSAWECVLLLAYGYFHESRNTYASKLSRYAPSWGPLSRQQLNRGSGSRPAHSHCAVAPLRSPD